MPPMQELRSQMSGSKTVGANCLAIELTGKLQPEKSDSTQFLDLYLTLDFREAAQKLGDGRFKFGLAGGKLKLKIDGATISPGWRSLLTTINSTAAALPCQVQTAGTEAEPTWIFAPQSGSSVLNGSLESVKLLALQAKESPQARPISIEAIFEIEKTDLRSIEAEGLWPHDISPNKHAILEQKLIQFLLQKKFQAYASRVELQYSSFSEPPKVSSDAVEISDADLSELEGAIARILKAGDRDFLALANLAELNPALDFVGAKLVATDLRDIDLSGINLTRANLRGSDLTDTNLNNTDLSGASLAGADLSGAMLGDANLKGANLQRCSLALANLGGANLAGANLQEANLSNANLSDADLTDANLTNADLHQAGLVLTTLTGANLAGANVTAARFKKDRGISEEMERDLKQRGAIFEDE